MGRGRAKAKQVKVARQLKYSSGGMDLDRLRAEIVVGTEHRDSADETVDGSFDDRYTVADEDDYDDEDEDDLSEDDLDTDAEDRALR
jgi:Protein of unknown function (DUF3073)